MSVSKLCPGLSTASLESHPEGCSFRDSAVFYENVNRALDENDARPQGLDKATADFLNTLQGVFADLAAYNAAHVDPIVLTLPNVAGLPGLAEVA